VQIGTDTKNEYGTDIQNRTVSAEFLKEIYCYGGEPVEFEFSVFGHIVRPILRSEIGFVLFMVLGLFLSFCMFEFLKFLWYLGCSCFACSNSGNGRLKCVHKSYKLKRGEKWAGVEDVKTNFNLAKRLIREWNIVGFKMTACERFDDCENGFGSLSIKFNFFNLNYHFQENCDKCVGLAGRFVIFGCEEK